jgi:hypothetical protein
MRSRNFVIALRLVEVPSHERGSVFVRTPEEKNIPKVARQALISGRVSLVN